MVELNNAPNNEVFGCLMSIVVKNKNYKYAIKVYQMICSYKIIADSYIYSILIKSLIEANILDEACSICQDSFVNKIKLNESVYKELLIACNYSKNHSFNI